MKCSGLFCFDLPNPDESSQTPCLSNNTKFFEELKKAKIGENPKKSLVDLSEKLLNDKTLNVSYKDNYQMLFEELMEINVNPSFSKICKCIRRVFEKDINQIVKDEKFIQDKKNLSDFIYAIKIKSSSRGYDLKSIKLFIKIICFVELINTLSQEPKFIEKSPAKDIKRISSFLWLKTIIRFFRRLFGTEEKKEERDEYCRPGVINDFFRSTIKLPPEVFPITKPKIKDVGVGDLLVVKEKIKRYETGEIAHIENVLKGEFKERSIRNLKRREETFIMETEWTKEEEQELNSSERFELQQESSKILQEEVNSKSGAGFSVDAGIKGSGIGFTYYVDGNVNGFVENSSSTNTQNAERKASNFAREVSNKAASRITERKREEQIRRVINEIEEINKHGIDNRGRSKHEIGIYQWVDKVYEAQVFNYGQRMLFDFMVPEPASFLREVLKKNTPEIIGLYDPGDFTLTLDAITPGQYLTLSELADYRVSGIKAPPEPYRTVSKAFKGVISDKKGLLADSVDKITIPNGYIAEGGKVIVAFDWYVDTAALSVSVGSFHKRVKKDDSLYTVIDIDLVGEEIGEIPVAIEGTKVAAYSVTVEINCVASDTKVNQWKNETFDTILTSYQNLKSDYEEKLKSAQIQAGVQISGRNPAENRRIEKAELKKSIISILSDEQAPVLSDKPFDDFDAIDVVPVNDDNGTQIYESHQVDVDESLKEGRIIRFFEQAFEWEHIMYVLYPYFWSRKETWLDRILTEDSDPKHAEFLRAGSARVVVPVSENFEDAVTHFLETGNIPTDNEMLDLHSDLYKPIADEIRERHDATGKQSPVGEPWEVKLPTALVRLRNDSSLPKWKKNPDGTWVLEN